MESKFTELGNRILSHSIKRKSDANSERVAEPAEGAASAAVSNFKIPNNPQLNYLVNWANLLEFAFKNANLLGCFCWPSPYPPNRASNLSFEEACVPTVLEKGRKQVGELEVFLGGKPPAHAISQSKAALTDYARTHFAQRNAKQKRFGKLMAKSRERMLSSVRKDDPIIQRDLADAKEFLKERASRPIAKLKPEKVESQLVIGSQFTAKGLPFDADWTFGSTAHTEANANKKHRNL